MRVGFRHVLRVLADDDAELDFPVGFLGAAWQDHVVVRSRDARRRFHEDHGLSRHGHVGFGRVIRVVQADGHELADAADARTETRRSGRLAAGSPDRVRAMLRQRLRRKRLAGDVVDHTGQIPQITVRVDHPRPFFARLPESHQLHRVLPRRIFWNLEEPSEPRNPGTSEPVNAIPWSRHLPRQPTRKSKSAPRSACCTCFTYRPA